MSQTYRFRVVSSSPHEHVLRLSLIHPDVALVRPEHTWVFLDALRALSRDRALETEVEVKLESTRNLRDPEDLFGDRGSPFPEHLAALGDSDIAAYFAREEHLPSADYRVRTSLSVVLAETTCEVA